MNLLISVCISYYLIGSVFATSFLFTACKAMPTVSDAEWNRALRQAFGWLVFWWIVGPIMVVKTTWRRYYNIVTALEATPNDRGLWLVLSDGRRVPLGDAAARNPGNARVSRRSTVETADVVVNPETGEIKLASEGWPLLRPWQKYDRIVGTLVDILATQTGNGYWAVTAMGRIYCYGDAPEFEHIGSPEAYGIVCRRPIKSEAIYRKFSGVRPPASKVGAPLNPYSTPV